MFSITFRVADLFHFPDDEFQLVVGVVKMWRDANACAGPVVNNKFPANELFCDRACMFVRDRYCSGSLLSIFWARHSESRFLREIDQIIRLTHALFADSVDPDLINNAIAG